MREPSRPPRVAESTADALRRGDIHAFEELYVQLRGDVYNLAARIVGDRGEAEDITQEVFLRALRHLPGKADQVRPEAWVFRTTVNACYDQLRRRKPAPVEFVAGREAAAHDTYEQSATAAAVEEALGLLNPRYRTALVLKDLHGLGNAEIAEIMGVARGTVGVLLFRARDAFEKRYREIAPKLGASLPVAGLAVWLPPLALPPGLAGPPAFLAPLSAGPSSAAPLAPIAASATPIVGGLAKLAGALMTKAAIVAIAATAVTGGSMAILEARDAGPTRATPVPASTLPTLVVAPGAGSVEDHAALVAGGPRSLGHAAGPRNTAQSGAVTRMRDGNWTGDGTQADTGADPGGQNGAGTASGSGDSTGTGNGSTGAGGTDAGGTGGGTDAGGAGSGGTDAGGTGGGTGGGTAEDGTGGAADSGSGGTDAGGTGGRGTTSPGA